MLSEVYQHDNTARGTAVADFVAEKLAAAEETCRDYDYDVRVTGFHDGPPCTFWPYYEEAELVADDLEQLRCVDASSQSDAATERQSQARISAGLFTEHDQCSQKHCCRNRKNAEPDAYRSVILIVYER